MLGRAPYANPYLVNEVDQAIFNGQACDRFDVMTQYIDYAEQEHANGVHIKYIAKHLLGLFTGIPGARAFRRHLSTHMYDDSTGPDVIRDAALFVKELT